MKKHIINLILGVLLFPLAIYSISIPNYFWSFLICLFCILNIGIGIGYFDEEKIKEEGEK